MATTSYYKDMVAQRFARRHKYTPGSRLRVMTMDVFMLVSEQLKGKERP